MKSDQITPRVLVVDDDPVIRKLLSAWLSGAGYEVTCVDSGSAALVQHESEFSLVCLDLGLGDIDGSDVLCHLRSRYPAVPVIIITASTDVSVAVSAMREGAYDFVTKPIDSDRLLFAAERAIKYHELATTIDELRSEQNRSRPARLIGESPGMVQLRRRIERVLDSGVSVFIYGESGTGKELVARTLHENGSSRNGQFVVVNCAAIPESLLESELFGYKKSTPNGATTIHRGRFEQASGGTLFLDEIGEMSASSQAGLLRALQERRFRRVGGAQEVAIDVRVICATHRDLEAEVSAGRFREDLFYRLVVYPIYIPSLRKRIADIPALVATFINEFKDDIPGTVTGIEARALDALIEHEWPGNVRELRNAIHSAMLCCESERIRVADLPANIKTQTLPVLPSQSSILAVNGDHSNGNIVPLRDLERQAIQNALALTRGNIAEAARALGLGRATLYRRLAKFSGEAPPS